MIIIKLIDFLIRQVSAEERGLSLFEIRKELDSFVFFSKNEEISINKHKKIEIKYLL